MHVVIIYYENQNHAAAVNRRPPMAAIRIETDEKDESAAEDVGTASLELPAAVPLVPDWALTGV